jgi:molybdenum cofactor sulfurtransferase
MTKSCQKDVYALKESLKYMNIQMQELRELEFSRLDANGHVYLDYTGAGLYPESLVHIHSDLLAKQVLGNPHSRSPASLAMTNKIEAARSRVLLFFDADPNEYKVVFTLNSSGALKLVGESFPFELGSRFSLTADNHNSVNGIREFARAKRALVDYIPLNPELRVDNFDQLLSETDVSKHNLFAYPAQSNFSGAKHPLSWIELAHSRGYDVLLDAAAFVPTNKLSLRSTKPDFVCVSFYKMFGFPTGVGALIARNIALQKLRRPWFAGGTVQFVSAQNKVHLLTKTSGAFEDGTLNYLSIAAIPDGLDFLDRVGIDKIGQHVTELTQLLLTELQSLKHTNGEPLVRIYGPRSIQNRGGAIAFNLLDITGKVIDYRLLEDRAIEANISIRTGCFCNPGASEFAFEYPAVQAYRCFDLLSPEQFSLQQFSACMKGKPIGAIRASLGIASSEADVQSFVQMLRTFVDCQVASLGARTVPEIAGEEAGKPGTQMALPSSHPMDAGP